MRRGFGPGNKPHEHSPMRPLYQERKNKRGEVWKRTLVGYQCECNCGRIYTPNGNLSEPEILVNIRQWLPKWFPNKSHKRRLDALK